MALTFRIGDETHKLPAENAASLAEELQALADGHRGEWEATDVPHDLAGEIEDRLDVGDDEPIIVTDPAALEALQRALNSVVYEVGPAMQLHNSVDMARRGG